MAWQSQEPIVSQPLVSSLLRKAAWQRRWRSQLDCASATLVYGGLALYFSAAVVFGEVLLCRIGSGLFAAGLFYSLYWFLNAARFSSLPPDAVQRRDAIKNYLHWGVLPTMPAALLATLGWIFAEPQAWILAAGIFAFFLGAQYVTLQHQNQLGTNLLREIDLLDA